MPVVTALRERPRGRLEIDLDGRTWRLVPADAVVRAGLSVGRTLDREAARSLGRELRRTRALELALQALRHRDRSRGALEKRLASRHTPRSLRVDTIEALERAGLVDDARAAAARARGLADRGYGDAAIRFTLAQEAFGAEVVEEALAALDGEVERARMLLEKRGATERTLRFLAAKGFDTATLEDVGGFADRR